MSASVCASREMRLQGARTSEHAYEKDIVHACMCVCEYVFVHRAKIRATLDAAGIK